MTDSESEWLASVFLFCVEVRIRIGSGGVPSVFLSASYYFGIRSFLLNFFFHVFWIQFSI